MNFEQFKRRNVALLGAGKENMALLPFLEESEANIYVLDKNRSEEIEELIESNPKIIAVTGEEYMEGLERYNFIFKTSGMPLRDAKKAVADQKSEAIITSAIDLFLSLKKGIVIGVTGTKGKGTTSTMLESIVKQSGKKYVTVGNIGNPVFDSLEKITDDTIVIMELSSFQLEDVSHSPHISIVLPITQDHLEPLSELSPNYHLSVADYVEAKANIVRYQEADDIMIYSDGNSSVEAISKIAKSIKGELRLGDEGENHLTADGKLIINDNLVADLSTMPWQGEHFRLDAGLASLAATYLGIDSETITKGLKSYQTLPHRMQTIAEKKGIIFVDDSYATNPDSTIAALNGFTRPIVWIAGGSRKGVPFADLAKAVATSTVKEAVLLGEEAGSIADALSHYSPQTKVSAGLQTFKEVFDKAVEVAVSGDVVLLSPSCASKDMFKSAAERGDLFKKMVDDLPV